MKVKELVEKLKKLDQGLEVLGYTEDEDIAAEGQLFRLFDIDSVDVAEGEQIRTRDGAPTLKLGKSDKCTRLAVINLTADF